jgi:hypothetical protein
MRDQHIDWMIDSLLLIAVLIAAILIVDGASHKTEINQRTVNNNTYCDLVRNGKPHYKIERDCR